MVILTAYFEIAVTWSNNEGAFNVPEQLNTAFALAQRNIQQAAYLALLQGESQLLLQTPNPPIDQLNQTLRDGFASALQSMGFVSLSGGPAPGFQDGSVRVYAESWGINLTWDQGQVWDAVPSIALRSGSNDPNLPLAQVPDAARPTSLALTEEPVYPMAIGEVLLFGVDGASGVSGTQIVPFTETVQSELGLLEDSRAQFADASFGPSGGFAHLVQYLATTLGEMRALVGYGSGGWLGPNDATSIASSACGGASTPSILSCDDLHNAVSLAELLESLQYFRSYDPNATYALLSGLPPGPYQTLLSKFVSDGVVDGAALFLLLYQQPGSGGTTPGGIASISSGEGLASAAYSFVDRFKFDLIQQFFGAQAVDPTLTEPVVDWARLTSQGQAYAQARLLQWLSDYQNWLGISVNSVPAFDDTSYIPAEWCDDNGNCGTGAYTGGGACLYSILPAGSTINTYGATIANLRLEILGQNNFGFTPQMFTINEVITVPAVGIYPQWQDADVGTGAGGGAGYNLVDYSLLGEYNGASGLSNPLLGMTPGPQGDPYMQALAGILEQLNASMDHKSPAATGIGQKGYLDWLAYSAAKDGGNYSSFASAGLPDLSNPLVVNQVVNSTSYSLLTNGSSTLLNGVDALALQKLSTQATNASWLNTSWVWGAAHPDLMPADALGSTIPGGGVPPTPPSDNPSPGPADWWTILDSARLTAREWYQLMYNLYWGTSGIIPGSPVGAIDFGAMDNAQFTLWSQGVYHQPPSPGIEPDFAMWIQNESYISVYNWMGYSQPGYGEGECDRFSCANPATRYVGAVATGACSNGAFGTPGYAAWQNARSYFFFEEGTGQPSRTWNNVGAAVTCALLGPAGHTLGGASCAAAPYSTTGTPKGIDFFHYDTAPGVGLTSSFWNTKNATGDGWWGCWSPTVGLCPRAGQYDYGNDYGNFTNWTIDKIAPPLLNDTREMGQVGGWLSQLYAAADREIWQGANLSATIDKPWLENGVNYSFWQGNYTNELRDGQVSNESLQNLLSGMQVHGAGLTFTWTAPTSTIHLVDAQNDSSNMGIAPMTSTWAVDLHGSIDLNLTSSRLALLQKGYGVPTQLNVTVPINMDVPVTIYTPWNLGSGWDPLSTPLPGDPAYVLTRGVFGLVGNDYHAAPNFLPGTYLSAPLNALMANMTSLGRVLGAEGRAQASMLAGLPDRDVGASAPWAQNWTLLENTTQTALAATAGPYLAATQGYIALLNSELTAVPNGGPYTNVPWVYPAYFGFLGQLNSPGQQFNYYGYPGPTGFGNVDQYNLTFAGPTVGVNYFVDNNFRGASPGTVPVHGFCGAWSPTAPARNLYCGPAIHNTGLSYTFDGYWQEFLTPYRLSLSGSPTFTAPAQVAAARSYPSLTSPYLGPTSAYPAELSVSGVGGLPPPASTGFVQANQGYLPAPGAFSNYAAEQQWAAAYLFDGLGSATTPGVTELGYSTVLEYSTLAGDARSMNTTVDLQDAAGLFGSATQMANVGGFLEWFELNHEQIAYGLGGLSADPTTLASAEPYLLTSAYRNVTVATGSLSTPSTYAFLSSNLACTEGDLGGTGGGLLNTPTVLIGGGTPQTWSYGGALVED
ncbi:MAG: hypothetical protein KGJ23_01295 [Euryarchaeota archaeon]|nr:hypothetical protein [Euryarchaeota archaeon]MDE2043529.1 hypothetical protein [Thermoplasmata archaeon]